MVKPTVSRQVKMGKTKSEVSQRVESDATPESPGCLVLVGFSPVVTLGGDGVALRDTECISFAARRTRSNPRKWVVNKHRSQVCEPDQKLQLKTVILHGYCVCEIHVPRPVRFFAAKKKVG